MDNILLIYFLPFAIANIFFINSYLKYLTIYRKKKNPNYPLLPQEMSKYYNQNSTKFLKQLPLSPLNLWKIIFEHHTDKQLAESGRKTKMWFLILISVAILDFLFLILFFFLY